MADLTPKQRRFVIEYLKDFNGVQAAKRAGYQAKDYFTFGGIAHENLKKPQIRKAIDEYWSAFTMSAEEVIGRLAAQARADISEFIKPGGGIDWEAVQANGELVKRITHRKGQSSQIELHDAQAALEKIGRVHGIFVDKKQISGPDGGPLEIGIKEVLVEIPDDEAIVDGGGGEIETSPPPGPG
ncbi:MAG: terminase small subunit [Deltaproteobacteria bacterium]|nr:terminase small subunit [Deltaproteobacteria bacterium]